MVTMGLVRDREGWLPSGCPLSGCTGEAAPDGGVAWEDMAIENDAEGGYRDEDVSGGKIPRRERADKRDSQRGWGACSKDEYRQRQAPTAGVSGSRDALDIVHRVFVRETRWPDNGNSEREGVWWGGGGAVVSSSPECRVRMNSRSQSMCRSPVTRAPGKKGAATRKDECKSGAP